jgi:hypothetical protein
MENNKRKKQTTENIIKDELEKQEESSVRCVID